VGWQDRDWAKWSDDDCSRFSGGGTIAVSGALLAVVASLVGFVVLARPGGMSLFHLDQPTTPRVVYGSGLGDLMGRTVTCTSMTFTERGGQCSAWTPVLAGQRFVRAQQLPSGSGCSAADVDEHAGRWICVAFAGARNS